MNITINGSSHDLPSPQTIESVLTFLGMADQKVVVEHNKEAIFPRDYPQTNIADGDELEIVTIAAGG